MIEDAHVGSAESFWTRFKVDTIARRCNPRNLRADIIKPMKIHDDAFIDMIDMDVWRGDVWSRGLKQAIV